MDTNGFLGLLSVSHEIVKEKKEQELIRFRLNKGAKLHLEEDKNQEKPREVIIMIILWPDFGLWLFIYPLCTRENLSQQARL